MKKIDVIVRHEHMSSIASSIEGTSTPLNLSHRASGGSRLIFYANDIQNGRDLSPNTDKQRGMSLKKN